MPGLLASPWKPGQSGKPAGRPVGARHKVEGEFWRALADDFAEHGAAAVRRCRESDPVAYIKVVASLMPKDARIETNRNLTGLTYDELIRAREALRAALGVTDDRCGAAPTIDYPTPGTTTHPARAPVLMDTHGIRE